MEPGASFPPERVILRLLQQVKKRVGKPIHRTHLVKLVYLTDYIYSQHTGRTLTGYQYVRDHFGPNAVGNQIVKRADLLDLIGAIRIEEAQNPSGSFKFLYEATGTEENSALDVLSERIIGDVVEQYGGLDWHAAVAASKRTLPFKEAKPGELLKFPPPSSEVREIGEEIDRRRAAGIYNNPGVGTGLKELRAQIGIRRTGT
jgi:Protein of unknown function (DUF4065)